MSYTQEDQKNALCARFLIAFLYRARQVGVRLKMNVDSVFLEWIARKVQTENVHMSYADGDQKNGVSLAPPFSPIFQNRGCRM